MAGTGNPRFGTRQGETRQCETCGESFYVYPSTLSAPRFTGQYCSLRCKGASPSLRAKLSASQKGHKNTRAPARPPVVGACRECGDSFEYPSWRARAFFCSRDCWFSHIRKHPEALGNFRGGYEPYYGSNWADQRAMARERDNHTCQDCGLPQVRPALDVHHLVPRRTFSGDHQAANRLENLVTLCRPCHTRREASITKAIRQAV